jgi:hypothetical protein
VIEHKRGKPCDVLRLERKPFTLKLLKGSVHVKRVPEYDHVHHGRWVVVDLEGKGSHARSVPMAAWAKAGVDNLRHRVRTWGTSSIETTHI